MRGEGDPLGVVLDGSVRLDERLGGRQLERADDAAAAPGPSGLSAAAP
ncbi:hypothetical protein [Streptomyces sp. NPDC018059]